MTAILVMMTVRTEDSKTNTRVLVDMGLLLFISTGIPSFELCLKWFFGVKTIPKFWWMTVLCIPHYISRLMTEIKFKRFWVCLYVWNNTDRGMYAGSRTYFSCFPLGCETLRSHTIRNVSFCERTSLRLQSFIRRGPCGVVHAVNHTMSNRRSLSSCRNDGILYIPPPSHTIAIIYPQK